MQPGFARPQTIAAHVRKAFTQTLPPGSLKRRLALLSIWLILPWGLSTLILNTFLERQATQAALLRQEKSVWHVAQTFHALTTTADWLTATAANFAVRENGDCDALRPLWDSLLANASTFHNLALFAPDGRLLCTLASPQQTPINAADQVWFQRAVASETMRVGDIQTSRITGEEVLVFGRAVRDDEQRIRWVIGLGAPLAALLPFDGIPPTTSILFHTPTQLMRFDTAERRFTPAEEATWASVLTRPADETTPYLVTRIPLDAEASLLFAFPREEALQSVHGTVAIVSMITLLVLLVMLTTLWSSIHTWITMPLEHLHQTAQKLAKGNLSARASTPLGTNEFDALATTFNSMASQLQEQIQAYEDAITAEQSERTFLEAVATLLQYALREHDSQTLLQFLADHLGALFDADGCYITLWDTANNKPIPTAAYGEYRNTYTEIHPSTDKRTITQSVLEEGRPLAIENVHASPYVAPEIAALFETQSVLALPLIGMDDEPMGAMIISYHTPHTFSERDIEHAQLVANLCALILHKNHLLEHISEQLQELHTIHAIAAYAPPLYTLEELPTYLLEELSRSITFDIGILIYETPDESSPHVSIHYNIPQDENHLPIEWHLRQIALETLLNQQPVVYVSPAIMEETERGQVIAVPFASTTGLLGALVCYAHAPIYVNKDLQHLQGIVQQIANTLENNRLFYSVLQQQDALQTLARTLAEVEERERQTIAQALHDESGQHLAALSITLNLLRHALETQDQEQVHAYVETLQHQLNTLANALRNIMALLHPPMLAEFGLAHTLEWLATTTETRTGIPITCSVSDLPDNIPLSIQIALYRIAQEALNNAVRHADATLITLSLLWDAKDRQFVLSIRDNGRGFAPEDVAPERLGLTGMQNRAMALGGYVSISSAPNRGTLVRAVIPFGATS